MNAQVLEVWNKFPRRAFDLFDLINLQVAVMREKGVNIGEDALDATIGSMEVFSGRTAGRHVECAEHNGHWLHINILIKPSM